MYFLVCPVRSRKGTRTRRGNHVTVLTRRRLLWKVFLMPRKNSWISAFHWSPAQNTNDCLFLLTKMRLTGTYPPTKQAVNTVLDILRTKPQGATTKEIYYAARSPYFLSVRRTAEKAAKTPALKGPALKSISWVNCDSLMLQPVPESDDPLINSLGT